MNDIRLLVDGKKAFPELVDLIREAKESIIINMFIWRDDDIGNILASELLCAAERGVKIGITKDRYGISCECSEEGRRSFFHTDPTLYEQLMISGLTLLYNRDLFGHIPKKRENEHRILMEQHPNIRIHADENRYDHSKFYIFDKKILVFGGINIEDKENGHDRQGRYYHDYMVRLDGEDIVDSFLCKRKNPVINKDGIFAFNIKEPKRVFEIEQRYLDLINGAEKELSILMAYFSPEPAFIKAIADAAKRGVKVRIVIPHSANFTDDTNKMTLKILHKECSDICFYLSPKMLHAKLLMSEKMISVGSSNINKKAFRQLDELNLFVPNDDSAFAKDARTSVEDTINESEYVSDMSMLKNNSIFAMAERIIM